MSNFISGKDSAESGARETAARGLSSFAFLGDIGSFSHEAAIAFAERYELEVKAVPCRSFADLFDLVKGSQVAYGVIPLENSTCGTITANYDLLWNSDCQIVEELLLAVEHHLIGLPGATLEQVQEVYSHPAALEQCTKLFRQNRQMQSKSFGSTVTAAKMIKETGDASKAAIASWRAAQESGLEIIARAVQDYANNTTRFALLKAGLPQTAGTIPENCKVSIVFQLEHKKGTLAHLLNVLSEAGANLTKIESRPIGKQAWHYIFFGDFFGITEMDVLTGILSESTESFRIIGAYPAQTIIAE